MSSRETDRLGIIKASPHPKPPGSEWLRPPERRMSRGGPGGVASGSTAQDRRILVCETGSPTLATEEIRGGWWEVVRDVWTHRWARVFSMGHTPLPRQEGTDRQSPGLSSSHCPACRCLYTLPTGSERAPNVGTRTGLSWTRWSQIPHPCLPQGPGSPLPGDASGPRKPPQHLHPGAPGMPSGSAEN